MVSLLAVPRRWIRDEVERIRGDLKEYRADFRKTFEDAVARELRWLTELDNLSPADRARLSPVITDAARCYYCAHWKRLYEVNIKNHDHLHKFIIFTRLLLLLVALLILPAPPLADFDGIAKLAGFLIAGYVTILLGLFFVESLPPRTNIALRGLAAIVGFGAVAEYNRWAPHIPSWWQRSVNHLSLIPAKDRAQMVHLPAAGIIQSVTWLIAVICFVTVASNLITYIGKCMVSEIGRGYRRPAEQSAQLLLGFLDISHLVTRLLQSLQDPSTSERRFVRLLTGEERQALRNMIYKLLRYVRTQWRQSMAASYGPIGQWIASHARSIEYFLRYQQSKNVLVGDNLFELRDAMISAMVDAADGNWHLIGAKGDYGTAILTGRLKKAIRKTMVLCIAIGGAIAVIHYGKALPATAASLIIVTCFTFAIVELLGFLDPDSPERLGIASQVVNLLPWRK